MKYRIKETIDNNDISTFTVQKKILWWWVDSFAVWLSLEDAEKQIRSWQIKKVKHHTVNY